MFSLTSPIAAPYSSTGTQGRMAMSMLESASIATWPDGGVLDSFVVASRQRPSAKDVAQAVEAALDRRLHLVPAPTLHLEFDNGGVPGDTILPVTPDIMSGPTSTFIGASLLNWLMLSTMEWLRDHGHPLPVLRSQNIPGAIEHNRELGKKYQGRLSRQLA